MSNNTKELERLYILDENVNVASIRKIVRGILDVNIHDDSQEKTLTNYKREPIKLIIDSFGGSIYDGMALVNIIQTSKTPIHTYCYSKAMSMGLTIYSVGHKRFAHPLATFMHHQLSGNSGGQLMDMVESLHQKIQLQEMLDGLFLAKTKVDEKKVLEFRSTKTDWYFSGTEAFDMGVADELIGETTVKYTGGMC